MISLNWEIRIMILSKNYYIMGMMMLKVKHEVVEKLILHNSVCTDRDCDWIVIGVKKRMTYRI